MQDPNILYPGLPPGRKLALPVIHILDSALSLKQATIARDAGANGVFLCDHGASHEATLASILEIRAELPGLWLGLNMLGGILMSFAPHVRGVWTDNLPLHKFMEPHFGGVLFKGQPQDWNLLPRALAEGFIPVTSGPSTGYPAPPSRVALIRRRMDQILDPENRAPLALASGLTPQNVGDYRENVDIFMVATGVSRDFYNFDPGALAEFVSIVHGE